MGLAELVELQAHGRDKGFTDVEVRGRNLHLLIEAKKGIEIPGQAQLRRYRGRIENPEQAAIVSISAAPQYYAVRVLPTEVDGVRVVHRSWRDIRKIARNVRSSSSGVLEKLWLDELVKHLEDYMTSHRVTDNTVYVLPLSAKPIDIGRSAYTWIDVVRDGHYFHPVGNRWPTEPANYLGFRYNGKLQSVHHVRSWQITTSLKDLDTRWPDIDRDHFVYTLGPAIIPAHNISSGPIWQMRSYAAIDLLISGECKTLSLAFEETRRRLAEG